MVDQLKCECSRSLRGKFVVVVVLPLITEVTNGLDDELLRCSDVTKGLNRFIIPMVSSKFQCTFAKLAASMSTARILRLALRARRPSKTLARSSRTAPVEAMTPIRTDSWGVGGGGNGTAAEIPGRLKAASGEAFRRRCCRNSLPALVRAAPSIIFFFSSALTTASTSKRLAMQSAQASCFCSI